MTEPLWFAVTFKDTITECHRHHVKVCRSLVESDEIMIMNTSGKVFLRTQRKHCGAYYSREIFMTAVPQLNV